MHFVQRIDLTALNWLESARENADRLTPLVIVVTRVGGAWVVVGVGAAVALIALLARQPRLALLLVLVMALAVTLTGGTKPIILRARPEVAFRAVPAATTGSFPSGHATLSMAIYGSIALAVCNRLAQRWWQILILLGTGMLILAIGISRLYLGVHYVSDVIGGWCAGGAAAMLFLWLDWHWACRPASSAGQPSAQPAVCQPKCDVTGTEASSAT